MKVYRIGIKSLFGFVLVRDKTREYRKKTLRVNVNIENGFANMLVVRTGANYGVLAFNNDIVAGEFIDLFFACVNKSL